VIVAVVVAAGLGAFEVDQALRVSASPYPSPPSGWATFDTAWSDVSNGFAAFANGSWTVSFAEGVAADGPWSPPAALLGGTRPTLWNPCAAELSGISTLTFWNDSAYPSSDSPNVFSSGTAPLWTFVFNGTGTLTFVATWLSGHVILNAALYPESACHQLGVFHWNPWDAPQPSVELDSNAIATDAVQEGPEVGQFSPLLGGENPVPTPPAAGAALYFPGKEMLPSTVEGANLWTVAYVACGLPGELGTYAMLTGLQFNGTTGAGGEWFTSKVPCYDSYYDLGTNRTTLLHPPNSSGVYREWKLNISFYSSAVPPTWSLGSLNTSLLQWQLQEFATPNSLTPPAATVCGPQNPGFANCTPPSRGWYAVLLGANGGWLDSYPSTANGTAWTVADVPITTGDAIAFVGAPGTLTSDVFETPFCGEPCVSGGDYLTPP
jgi:hypothetical protein